VVLRSAKDNPRAKAPCPLWIANETGPLYFETGEAQKALQYQ
jgi:hypothetical protein